MEAQKGAPAMSLLTDGAEADLLVFVIAIALFYLNLISAEGQRTFGQASAGLQRTSHTQARWRWWGGGGNTLARWPRQVKRLPDRQSGCHPCPNVAGVAPPPVQPPAQLVSRPRSQQVHTGQ
ncbi:predicted protein [Verticillium alfalfae VaMs.102]|uniref:Predicted protein n=1 Tax=Verticillium alfalfae (strain VaMs.102 / ATCC MYA-4576 / FGSC 10136) TaxID=526221 RepID=C9SP13_VERA1|nr:predicted protein [Verticillium alfalfae VaMs.102]EEY20528.1 predicted protein [Verticillium alfalfae VaMs.102]